MIIGIIPKIRENYKDQIEFSIDEKLIQYLKKIFPKSKFEILIEKKIKKLGLLVISGGNDLTKHNLAKKNLRRASLNNYFFHLAKKKRLPILGICHGAHFLANQYGAHISKSSKHVGFHQIQTLSGKKIRILSHHNYVIKKISKKFEVLALAMDKTIELFQSKKMKILGIMWHPERQKKLNKFETNLIKKICY